MSFFDYLRQSYSESTCNTYCYLVGRFKHFEDSEDVDYSVILRYIQVLKRFNNDKSVNQHLVALRHYFNYKGFKYNPVNLHIKRQPTIISTNTLSTQQLNQLFDNWKTTDSCTSVRDKVIISLYVFQGLHSHEVNRLTTDDIDLTQLTINIERSARSNPRTLPLDIKQVLLFNDYLTVYRPQLLLNREDNTLILTQKQKNCLRCVHNQISIKLSKLSNHPNIRLIRISVIKNWLSKHNLRTVQYLAGHRYISSTERYVSKDLEHLKDSVNKFHPLG
jgi:site-specific recombinase XerD